MISFFLTNRRPFTLGLFERLHVALALAISICSVCAFASPDTGASQDTRTNLFPSGETKPTVTTPNPAKPEGSSDPADSGATSKQELPPVEAKVKTVSVSEAAAAGTSLDALKADPMDLGKRTAFQNHANSLSQINKTLNDGAKEQKWDPKDVRKTQAVMAILSKGSGMVPPKSEGGGDADAEAPSKNSATYNSPARAATTPVEPVTSTETAMNTTPTLAAQTLPETPRSAAQIALARVQNNPALEELQAATIDKPSMTEPAKELLTETQRSKLAAALKDKPELSDAEKFRNFIASETGIPPELLTAEVLDQLRKSLTAETAATPGTSLAATTSPTNSRSTPDRSPASNFGSSFSATQLFKAHALALGERLASGTSRIAIVLGMKIPGKADRSIASEAGTTTDAQRSAPEQASSLDLIIAMGGLGGALSCFLLAARRRSRRNSRKK